MMTARKIAPLAVAVLVGLALAGPASAVTLQRGADAAVAQNVALKAGDTVAVTAKTANLRASPSTKGKKVAALAKGTKLTVVSVEKGWVKVKGAAGDGYVSAKLVK
jgi:uncharacterized protein YgiM (DUF1202 family)